MAPGSKRSITNCAFKHHIVRRRSYVSEKRTIYGCRAHHGRAGLLPRRGNLVGDPGRECERRPHVRSKVALQALESRLGHDKTRQERGQRACALSATDHAARHIRASTAPRRLRFLVSVNKGVSELQPQGACHWFLLKLSTASKARSPK